MLAESRYWVREGFGLADEAPMSTLFRLLLASALGMASCAEGPAGVSSAGGTVHEPQLASFVSPPPPETHWWQDLQPLTDNSSEYWRDSQYGIRTFVTHYSRFGGWHVRYTEQTTGRGKGTQWCRIGQTEGELRPGSRIYAETGTAPNIEIWLRPREDVYFRGRTEATLKQLLGTQAADSADGGGRGPGSGEARVDEDFSRAFRYSMTRMGLIG